MPRKTSSSNAEQDDVKSYDTLARETMALWQEQLAHFLNNPDAMREFNKLAEPAAAVFAPLFSQGMDLWLTMLEQVGKATTSAASAASGSHDTAQNTATGQTHETKPQQGGDAHRTSPAAALSGASTYAVAELSRRLAELEKRFAEYEGTGKPAAAPLARKKKSVAAEVAEPRAKRSRRNPKT